jgi:hypothetical protein
MMQRRRTNRPSFRPQSIHFPPPVLGLKIGTIIPGDYMPDRARSCNAVLEGRVGTKCSPEAEGADAGGACVRGGDRSDIHGTAGETRAFWSWRGLRRHSQCLCPSFSANDTALCRALRARKRTTGLPTSLTTELKPDAGNSATRHSLTRADACRRARPSALGACACRTNTPTKRVTTSAGQRRRAPPQWRPCPRSSRATTRGMKSPRG